MFPQLKKKIKELIFDNVCFTLAANPLGKIFGFSTVKTVEWILEPLSSTTETFWSVLENFNKKARPTGATS